MGNGTINPYAIDSKPLTDIDDSLLLLYSNALKNNQNISSRIRADVSFGTILEISDILKIDNNINEKYIITNAAHLKDLNAINYKFCPISTVVDSADEECHGGCNPNTKESREIGNTDILITTDNKNISYHVYIEKLTPETSNNNAKVGYKLKIGGSTYSNEVEEYYKNQAKKHTLGAAGTLKSTCQGIIDKLKLGNNDWATIEKDTILSTNITNILLSKSLGDIIQELNATIKFGGYKGTVEYFDSEDVKQRGLPYPYDKNGDAIRCILSGDRPSGVRVLFYKLFFPVENINKLSFGGYYNQSKVDKYFYLMFNNEYVNELITNHKQNPPTITFLTGGGNSNRMQKTIKHKKKGEKSINKKRKTIKHKKKGEKSINKKRKTIKHKKKGEKSINKKRKTIKHKKKGEKSINKKRKTIKHRKKQ